MTETLDRRYLHIAGAVAAGGWFPAVGPMKVNVPIPTIDSLHLPIVGGIADARTEGIQVDCRGVDFGKVSAEERARLESQILMTLGPTHSRLETVPRQSNSDSARSFTTCEIADLTTDGLALKQGVLNMQMVHPPSDPYPHVTFGDTQIIGLSLDGNELQITLDTQSFNAYDTLAALDEAYRLGKLPQALANSLTRAQQARAGVANPSGYVVGTLVSRIEGNLPQGAHLDADGYTIDWTGFGKIHIGEVTMSNFLRRVSLLRIERCQGEYGSGCSGGTYYP